MSEEPKDQEKVLLSPRSGFFSFISQLSPRGKKELTSKDSIQKVEQNLENNLKDFKEEHELLKEILQINQEIILSKHENYYKKTEKALFNLRSSLETTNQEEQMKSLGETKNLQSKFLSEKSFKEVLVTQKKLVELLPGEQREKINFEKIKCKISIPLNGDLDGTINCTAISPNSHYIAVGLSESTKCILVFSSFSGRLVKSFSGVEEVHSILFSVDGCHIYAGGNNNITIWNFNTGKLEQTLEGHKRKVACLANTPDGRYLISGDQNSNDDSTIIIWELPNFKISGRIFRLSKIKSIISMDDSKQFYVEIESFNEPTYLLSYKMNGESILSKKVNKRLDRIALLGKDLYYGEITKEDDEVLETKINVFSTEENLHKFNFTCKLKGLSHLIPSTDGVHLALVGMNDNNILLFGNFGLDLGILDGHKTEISSLLFSPDNTYLISSSISNKENASVLKIWN